MSTDEGKPPFIPRRVAQRTYRPHVYGMSEGLKRARQPYRVRNAIIGVLIGAFSVGVWAYSISAVKQDVFDDVDDQARALAEEREKAKLQNHPTSDPLSPKETLAIPELTPIQPVVSVPLPAIEEPRLKGPGNRGVLVKLLGGSFPRLFEPSGGTLVWGAPAVDSIGNLKDSSSPKTRI
ncbi:hypothetical protein JAAARDRAFT_64093 [Jaapia argillacea MUCL 33604]|uniref:Cytochrome c oxidase assembly factor 3 n=1 Tax=Jaapia argillacea MUCL 33604 TaxID=933084 RepID=A0A067QL00_9AGAM|nr:hypothetical protein JAAARDRAFT_64093 [Jaapia argillacea MUCL 33604]